MTYVDITLAQHVAFTISIGFRTFSESLHWPSLSSTHTHLHTRQSTVLNPSHTINGSNAKQTCVLSSLLDICSQQITMMLSCCFLDLDELMRFTWTHPLRRWFGLAVSRALEILKWCCGSGDHNSSSDVRFPLCVYMLWMKSHIRVSAWRSRFMVVAESIAYRNSKTGVRWRQ